MEQVIASMTTLNRTASEIGRNFCIHACTDVTGFGFLGHLHEMMDGRLSSVIYADQVPVFDGAMECAEEFLLTAAGQKNRNHLEEYVKKNKNQPSSHQHDQLICLATTPHTL